MKQSILIVGGTSGLGKRLCELYCLNDCKVGVIGRRQDLLQDIFTKNPNNIIPFPFDISSSNCVEEVTRFIKEMNGVDKVIITASVVDFNTNLDYAIEKDTVDINVSGIVAVLNAVYKYFYSKNDGHIIVVTSTASARGNKVAPAYNASKAFQSSYLDGLRLRLHQERKDVVVTELVPGYMDTQMAKGNRLFWVSSVDKAARLALKAIDDKKEKAFITKRWALIFYIYKFMPMFLYKRLVNSSIKLGHKK